MTYAAVFMTWLTLLLAYLAAGALLIPREYQDAYNRAPRDAGAARRQSPLVGGSALVVSLAGDPRLLYR